MAFIREFTSIEALRNTSLFNNCLLPDIKNGKVFPAIRKNEIHFYYQGGRLFKYDGNDFFTHIKYAFNSDKDYTDIKESELKTLKPVDNFVGGYEKIKACCKVYSAKSEACNVAKLFKNYSYVISDENKVLLDIEAAMESESDEKNIDRFDLVLFDKEKATLQIAEAKLYCNNEIRAQKGSVPSVVEQIKIYEKNIAKHEKEIITAYKDYVKIVNKLFTVNERFTLNLPEPEKINNTVNLLIFDFDDKQREKLQKEVNVIKDCLSKKDDNLDHKIYIRGNVGNDRDQTILKNIFSNYTA